MPNNPERRGGLLHDLYRAMTSWRTASVALLSFSSGLPLGLVWIAIPDWMRSVGVDIRIIGLFTLAQAPWTFKILWAPLVDRYVPPFWGRRRGWAAITQVALLILTLALAGVGSNPEAPWVVFALTLAIAFAAATQDIAIDAYAVDVLRPEEQGVAVGARTAVYRAAMFAAGGLAITVAGMWSWKVTCIGLALCYIPMLFVTWKSPEPETPAHTPTTLREAVWLPFLGFLSRHRSLEILAFVLLYKLADNLSQSLMRPFLQDMGYDSLDRGLGLATLGTLATIGGTFFGGALTNVLGLGRSLWVFGFLQIFSNVGFILVANSPPNRPLMFAAMGFESLCTGLGMGAFAVLLLRMTQKRFSATQYALFSALFGLPRILAGPVTGVMVDAVGWSAFFWFTMLAGVPGLVMLARFVPIGTREPVFTVEPPGLRPPLTRAGLAWRAAAGGVGSLVVAAGSAVTLGALKTMRDGGDRAWSTALDTLISPSAVGDWITLAGVVVFTVTGTLFFAAVAVARHRA